MSDTIKPVARYMHDSASISYGVKWLIDTPLPHGALLYSADALETLRKEKEVADSFYAVAMAELKRERATVDRLREENEKLRDHLVVTTTSMRMALDSLDDDNDASGAAQVLRGPLKIVTKEIPDPLGDSFASELLR